MSGLATLGDEELYSARAALVRVAEQDGWQDFVVEAVGLVLGVLSVYVNRGASPLVEPKTLRAFSRMTYPTLRRPC